jgi:hypothetical protein
VTERLTVTVCLHCVWLFGGRGSKRCMFAASQVGDDHYYEKTSSSASGLNSSDIQDHEPQICIGL